MKGLAEDIDFADASYIACQARDDVLIVYITSWNSFLIKVVFHDVLQYKYKAGSFISGVFERKETDEFMSEALSNHYERIPSSHPFKNYVIKDIEDCFVFEVIADRIIISREEVLQNDYT